MRGIPGPRVTVSLIKVGAAKTATLSDTLSESVLETFTAVLQQMSGSEALVYAKETNTKVYSMWCDAVKLDGTVRTIEPTYLVGFGARRFRIVDNEDPAEQSYFYRLILQEMR